MPPGTLVAYRIQRSAIGRSCPDNGELRRILREATAAIEREYFLLPIHGADTFFRERVYCYELYHQMRLRWPRDCPYFLNGDVDKQSHPYVQGANHPKPDMLVHVPGTGNNYAILEVKSLDAPGAGLRKDLLRHAHAI